MTRTTLAVTTLAALVLACNAFAMHHEGEEKTHTGAEEHAKKMSAVNHAVAVMIPTEGNKTHGTVGDLRALQRQVITLFDEGKLVQYCDGPCDPG